MKIKISNKFPFIGSLIAFVISIVFLVVLNDLGSGIAVGIASLFLFISCCVAEILETIRKK